MTHLSDDGPGLSGEEAEGIAVIGMAGRFPGARDLDAYWANLRSGTESIQDVADEELAREGVPDELLDDPHYIRRAAPVDGVDEFDAELFGFTPQAARTMDPQQRLLLQLSWHALENAGYDPLGCDGAVGVFATSSVSSYLLYNLLSRQDTRALLGAGLNLELVQLVGGNDPNFTATRIAHSLDLRGPAVGVQTACSSGLVAVHLACQSLLAGETDMALAAGVSVRVPHRAGYLYDPGAIMSPDGRCRPFDAEAAGTVFGSGGGAVLLKPLSDALAAGDPVHAVIKGSAINNDGAQKMGYTAPSIDGQAQVVAEALAVADVDPASVGYIEAHGTGTALGDPIEVAALATAFESVGAGDHIGIGSVKANVGHLEVAAGLASFIKTVLSLRHRELVPTPHYRSPNPELGLEKTPFHVVDTLTPWSAPGPLRAGASALGVGGTNAHVVLEEAPSVGDPRGKGAEAEAGRPVVLLVSGRDREQASASARVLADRLEGEDPPALEDVATTLATGRHHHPCRRAVVARTHRTAAEALRTPGHLSAHEGRVTADDGGALLLMPGQGSQYGGMTAGLYRADSHYRRHLDWAAAGLSDLLGLDVLTPLIEGPEEDLRRTDLAQAALFAVEYALARRLEEQGVRTAAVAGHSVGEYTAACLAGVLSPDDALRTVAARGRLMHTAPAGVMLTVGLPQEAAQDAVEGTELEVAAVNEPGSTVVAGPADAAERLAERLTERGVTARRLHTAHAFHTAALDQAAEEFAAHMASVALHPPATPMLSGVTGTWMTDEEARDADRWARQIRLPVRFADLLSTALGGPDRILVECGPGRTLTTFARRSPAWDGRHRALRLVRHPREDRDDHETYLLGLGALWAAGTAPDRQAATPQGSGRRVPLPGLPFRRDRYWISPRFADPGDGTPDETAGGHAPDLAAGDGPAPTAPDTGAPGPVTGGSSEELISGIWSDVLGIPDIGAQGNFFDLGGDSVVAVQVASRATRAGLPMSPQDVFQHQTVSALAAALAPTSGEQTATSAAPSVTPPLTPVQQMIVDRAGRRLGTFTVPLLLDLAPGVSPDVAREAVRAVIAHHDALRLRLEQRDGLWGQRIDPPETSDDLEIPLIPVPDGPPDSEPARLAATLTDLGRSLQDRPGPLLRAAILESGAGAPARLALVLHHFCVDNASERILLEDLTAACTQLLDGREVRQPEATTAWSSWAGWAAGLAADPEVHAERGQWLEVLGSGAATGLPAHSAPSTDVPRRDACSAEREMPREATGKLLEAQRARRARLDELLLAAVAVAVAEAAGTEDVVLEVEGHGRGALPPGFDLDRTIGTCTTLHPVRIGTGRRGAAGAAEAARRALRDTPREGLGYGVLRTLHAPSAALLADRPQPDLLVAYLGTVTYDAVGELAEGPLRPSAAAELSVRSVPACLTHGSELRAYLHHGRLHLDWWFDPGRYAAETVETALDRVLSALDELAADSVDTRGTGATDTPWADVNQDELRMLFGEQHRDM
ncbi:type I polyketide synthase [Streptomyces sulphureus]|uniref:type I polyketide synthase n=1 Tax=Streptomyces sulphureus TaxID=47758 RepID=UPI0003676D4A|nr:type I polyketide synthase [Streptomyces sulphureus]